MWKITTTLLLNCLTCIILAALSSLVSPPLAAQTLWNGSSLSGECELWTIIYKVKTQWVPPGSRTGQLTTIPPFSFLVCSCLLILYLVFRLRHLLIKTQISRAFIRTRRVWCRVLKTSNNYLSVQAVRGRPRDWSACQINLRQSGYELTAEGWVDTVQWPLLSSTHWHLTNSSGQKWLFYHVSFGLISNCRD